MTCSKIRKTGGERKLILYLRYLLESQMEVMKSWISKTGAQEKGQEWKGESGSHGISITSQALGQEYFHRETM